MGLPQKSNKAAAKQDLRASALAERGSVKTAPRSQPSTTLPRGPFMSTSTRSPGLMTLFFLDDSVAHGLDLIARQRIAKPIHFRKPPTNELAPVWRQSPMAARCEGFSAMKW